MSHKAQLILHKPVDNLFRLKPLVACMRVVIAGGLFAGSVVPVHADLPVSGVTAIASPTGVAIPWVGSGSADQLVNGNTLQINQHSDKAILNWQSFNVGKENTVQFVQPDSGSVALNRIYQQDPSQILGQITANGQVYLYNQNGFVFGKDSVVNTNTLLASTLNITDDVFKNSGITQVFDKNGGAALAIEPTRPGAAMDPKTARILIEAGAKIHTDKNGRIIIAAPTIVNQGSLSSDNQGQIILAASEDKVYLQAADPSSPFAGLVVEVDTGGKVINTGDILAKQGNITMAGFAVNQEGRVSATTSVNVNGSIRLLAQEQHGSSSGQLIATNTTRASDNGDGLGAESKLTFGSGSVTQIVADNDGATAIDEQKQPQSYLEANAHNVELDANSAIVVPRGKVNITATNNLVNSTQGTTGRIYMDKTALIDVSGYKGVNVAMERNVAQISAQSFELRNSPKQIGGVLQGQTVQVDIRNNTPIVDISGAVARIQRGVEERLSSGGQINLSSSGDVIINDNAKINISGGSVNYQDGFINTTKLVNDYGKIVDISAADPNQHYSSIFGVVTEEHKKWGITTIWDLLGLFGQGQFQQGYVEGKSAGAITIQTPLLDWNGNLSARSIGGIYQRSASLTPFGGSFTVDMTPYRSVQDIIFQAEKNHVQLAAADPFPKRKTGDSANLVLDTSLLNNSGVQNVSVKTWGGATVVDGTAINMSPGGSLSIEASSIDVNGSIKSAGGGISLTAATNVNFGSAGQVTLAKQATLDVSGGWINDLPPGPAAKPVDQLHIDGGSVKISGQGDVLVNAGSSIKADGGAWLSAIGRLTSGKGGSIDLAAVGNGVIPSALQVAGDLSAYSLSQGGSLKLDSSKIIVGAVLAPIDLIPPLVLGVHNGSLDIAPDMSFSKIGLNGNVEGITVKSNVALDLKTQNLVLQSSYRDRLTGSSIRDFSSVVLLPENLRSPLQLDLTGTSGVTLETGSSITVDKGSTVNLAATAGSIFVDGAINAPAGNINLSIVPLSGLEYDPAQTIWLGAHAGLLALGDTRLNPVDVIGRRSGSVLDGGNVTVNAERGTVILEKGAMIDVSGTHAQLDLLQPTTSGVGLNYAATTIGSNAGKIAITAAEGIVLDGNMKGFAGTSTMQAGTLSLSLDRSLRNPPQQPINPFPSGNLAINVVQGAQQVLTGGTQFGDVIPDGLNGTMTVSADKVMAGGFSDVRLTTPGQVTFLGDVALKTAARINIDAQSINWAGLNSSTTGTVNLDSVYLKLGSSLVRDVGALPVTGGGVFTAHAQWTDLQGASLWNGFNTITLDSVHDLRTIGVNDGTQRDYLGTLVTAANLNLQASQIYPSTLSQFTFAVKNNPDGQINITGANTDTSPLSAAGNLTFKAPVINQNGVLKAPLGIISLIADTSLTLGPNSVTSVSAAGQLIPFGVIQGGLDWLYPLTNPQNLVFNTPPEKQIILNAPAINMEKGSKINIAGGGDLFGYEFKPVTDGFPDYLAQGGFAILPTLGSVLAPYDPFQSSSSAYAPGSQIYLSGTNQLPAGYYTILPAHYALLPGAFLVTPQTNSQDTIATTYTKDGLPIVSGHQTLAGTGSSNPRSSAFLVETSAQVLSKHTQYDLYTANKFYADKAQKNITAVPLLPIDSGQISIIAQTQLLLDGTINLAAPGGRGARMDIAADNIDVVNSLSSASTSGTLEILASNLNNLKVDSLLLGGARTRNVDGSTTLNVTSNTVSFESGTQLLMTDLVAAATQKVEVKTGAGLEAKGTVNTGDTVFNIVGDGAFIRLSSDNQIAINRAIAPGVVGELVVASGATLKAAKSMLLDASLSTKLDGDILMHGGSLNLSANAINMGDVAGLGGNALNLTNQKLLNLSVDELVLNSRGTVGFYGNVGQVDSNNNPVLGIDHLQVPITFNSLVVNAAGFSGFGNSGEAARLQANNLVLANPFSVASTTTGTGLGSLDIVAGNFTQGAGNFGINGFKTVNVNVNNGFIADGKSVLTVASDLNLNAAYLAATGGSSLKLDAGGYVLNANSNNSSISAVSPGFGGAMAFVADTVAFDANALLPSGKLSLQALVGNMTVGSAANIDLAGRAVTFADATDYTPGGSFTASADNGAVTLAKGSKLDISTGGGLAAGGNLVFNAPKQAVTLAGDIKAGGGSAGFDVSTFSASSSFDSLMATLNNAGIANSIYFRSRDVDIVQAATNIINANNVTLVADKGAVDLFGQTHVNGVDQGGKISVYAGGKISLENGSQLTATGAKGGKVLLSSVDGNGTGISDGIVLKSGSLIDVSGANTGNGGNVTLRALRAGDSINIRDDNGQLDQLIAGTITGANNFYAEGVKKYSNADLSSAGQINAVDIAKIKTNTDAYMTTANMTNVATTLGHGISLTPGVEIDYTGNLALNSTWDLAGWRYNGNAGDLVIRASNNLQFDQSLSDGFTMGSFTKTVSGNVFNYILVDQLQTGQSWSYSLAAGSELTSADTNRVSSLNNLVVNSNVKVRTGTGDMQISAGGDITITAGASVNTKLSSDATYTSKAPSQSLQISDTSGLKVGAYLSSTSGIAAGTTVASIDSTGTSQTISTNKVVLGSFSLGTVNVKASGWVVGDTLLPGSGIPVGTTITSINPTGTSNQTSSKTSTTSLVFSKTTGWVVGDYLTGAGIATGTTIKAITGNTVTLSKAVTAAFSVGENISTLPSVQLNKAVTSIINTNTSIKTLPSVHLSEPITASLAAKNSITASYTPGMIYNAGQASSVNPYGTLGNAAVAQNFYGEYPVNGGDLTLSAGGNINGAVSNNNFNDWLLRIGTWTGSSGQPTAWGIALGYVQGINPISSKPLNATNVNKASMPSFQQNIGSFGGGNVTIKAAGDIANLEVVMPTTGKPMGSNTADNLDFFVSNQVEVNGGGNLQVSAGGDVAGGSFYVGKGTGLITAGDQVTGSNSLVNGPALYSGDTQFTVNAGNGIQLAGVFDPMILHKGGVNFFSYTDASSLAVKSLAGNVTLAAVLPISASDNQRNLSTVYPASLQASAFGGSVNLKFDAATLFPSPIGQLNIFARQDIFSTGTGEAIHRLRMSDANSTLLPTALLPLSQTDLFMAVNRLSVFEAQNNPDYLHAAVPVHTTDNQSVRFVTALGDIKNVGLYTPKKTLVKAGRDISNVTLAIQNIKSTDASIIEAGRDLVYPGDRSSFTGGLIPSTGQIEVAGPGDVLVKTGRNLDLGASNGLSTVGNTYNPGLSDKGANITVLAGLNGGMPNYVKFLDSYAGQAIYAATLQTAKDLITQFMRKHSGIGTLSEDLALSAFSALPSGDTLPIQSQLNSLLLPVMFNEIKLAGTASAGNKSLGNAGGYAAIDAFFPGNNWKGDLNLFFSKLQTIKGGDINMLVPGGQINAGLSVAFTGAKDATQLGIVAQQKGAINAVLQGDFLVNKSRVFSLDGSDIMIWSSDGNIDAGKGAKSAISAPPTKHFLDKNGNLVSEFPPIVAGSGIRTASSTSGVLPGNVSLFAPAGVVDAGEAGIGGTNVTISATAVLGANNIQVGGVSTGVPVASTGSLAAGLTGTSNMTANVSQVAQAITGVDEKGSQNNKNAALGMLSVEVLGFGD